MTVTGQSTVTYSYDNTNRLTQITQGSSVVSFGYDNANRRTSLTLPNGIVVEYGYDAASRVTGITYKQGGTIVLGDLTYEYDKAGNRNKVGGSFARTGIPEAVNTTNYNAANQQTTFGDKTLTYDNDGNLTSITDADGTTLYSWNTKNQLIGVSGPNVNASFVYDGMGRRQKKMINGNLTEFLYDGVNPVQETSGVTVLANILTGLGIDEFLTRTDVGTGATNHLLPDALGSALGLADSAGTIQTEHTYEPFGKTTTMGTSNTNPFQYTGRENDGTGLYYYRARYYHPELQRFLSEDPIDFSGGDINLYVYVGNSLATFVDPNGLARYGRPEYNAPPPRTEPVPLDLEWKVTCLELCLDKDLIVTGGSEKYCDPTQPNKMCHTPNSQHYNGNAVDFGFSANPGIQGMRKKFFCCAASCGFKYGQTETKPPHYHLQTVPGTGGGSGEIPTNPSKDCCNVK